MSGESGVRRYTLYSLGPDGVDDGGRADDLGTAADGSRLGSGPRRALQLFPVAVLVAIAPLVWGLVRWAKRLAS